MKGERNTDRPYTINGIRCGNRSPDFKLGDGSGRDSRRHGGVSSTGDAARAAWMVRSIWVRIDIFGIESPQGVVHHNLVFN